MRRLATATATACGILGAASPALAQSYSTIAPSVGIEDPEFRVEGVTVGPIRVYPTIQATALYDSNVYATPDNERDDLVFIASPRITATYISGALKFDALANLDIVRFASLTTEDSEAFDTEARVVWQPSVGQRLSADAGFSRLVENRGDPEALNNINRGPRITNVTFGELQYRMDRGRWLLDTSAEVRKFNALSSSDDARDFTSYSAQAAFGMRVGGAVYGTLTGFVSQRDFRLGGTPLRPDRDSLTYGARLGFEVARIGLLEGRASAGVFRFEPESPLIQAHTGFSASASLTYRPRERTALVLNAFSGDVATFRLGAQSRSDTRVGLVLQQEVRHNLFGSAGLTWRQSKFRGNSITERTYIAAGDLEYLMSRNTSLLGSITFSKRTSADPSEPFERARFGLTLRLRG